MKIEIIYFIAAAFIIILLIVVVLKKFGGNVSAMQIKKLQEDLLLSQNTVEQQRQIMSTTGQQLAQAETRSTMLQEQLTKAESTEQDYRATQNQLLHSKNALANAEEKLASQKEELAKMAVTFKHEFENLAQKILDEKTKKFTDTNEEKMNHILQPFKTQLVAFKDQVEKAYKTEGDERIALKTEVQNLVSMTQQVSAEANNLSTALKGNNKIQGQWGELILERILEHSGLGKNREFYLQEFIRDAAGNVIKDDEGRGLQPDATIVYPDGRKIIIDSKVSLLDWDAVVAAGEHEEQQRYVQQMVKSIKRHIDGLSKKNYPHYAGALDAVLMFIPIEPAFLEATKADPNLWQYAFSKNILLVSPNNLLAVLKIVASMWKVEQQSQNAIKIAESAGALYDKFAGFIYNFEAMGKKLNEAQSSYEVAHKQLTSGNGNITGKVAALKEMGAKAKKQLPGHLIEDDTEN